MGKSRSVTKRNGEGKGELWVKERGEMGHVGELTGYERVQDGGGEGCNHGERPEWKRNGKSIRVFLMVGEGGDKEDKEWRVER